jgi:polyisoprenyl-phosphate glycosyltransferase
VTPSPSVAVVVPVHGNEDTLPELVRRLSAALADRPWRLRLVIDASPDASAEVAARLAQRRRPGAGTVVVTVLERNVGQHKALELGLLQEPDADAWVCLDADLQDPPEAVPALLDRLVRGDVAAVFAGRRGRYEGWARLLTGRVHRALLARLTGLPPGAGAFLALDVRGRAVVLERSAPSLVAAIGAAGLPTAAVAVERAARPTGRSAWTARARLRQSARTLAWTWRVRRAAR